MYGYIYPKADEERKTAILNGFSFTALCKLCENISLSRTVLEKNHFIQRVCVCMCMSVCRGCSYRLAQSFSGAV